jgi:hypothetical protein
MAIKEREEQRWRSERERSNDVQREREEEQMRRDESSFFFL